MPTYLLAAQFLHSIALGGPLGGAQGGDGLVPRLERSNLATSATLDAR
jgi:hypothetical protein